MPRPRRDSEILPAKERLENAFWELLSEREYRKITVTDIVRTADVNRNSFYYHFQDIPSLLGEISVGVLTGSRCSPDRTARRNSSNPCRTSAGSR